MKQYKKRYFLVIVLSITYILSIIFMLFYLKDKNKMSMDEKEYMNIKKYDSYNIYALNKDKKKYDKITQNDLIKIDIYKTLNNEGDVTAISLDKEDLLNFDFVFNEDIDIDYLSGEYYLNENLEKGKIVYKMNLIKKEDIMKEKILNMSYQNLMCFEVKCPYTYDDNKNVMEDNYKALLENFELGKDVDIKVYAKDKVNQVMTKIIDDAKLIDITSDKATISIYGKDSEVLNNYKDAYDIIISNMNIE